jgi:hypothetical protein
MVAEAIDFQAILTICRKLAYDFSPSNKADHSTFVRYLA